MADQMTAVKDQTIHANMEPLSKAAELQNQLDQIFNNNVEFAKAEIFISGGESNQKMMGWFDITRVSPVSDEDEKFNNLSASVQDNPTEVDTKNLSDLALNLNQALDPKNNLTVSTPAGYMVGTRLQVIRNGPVGNCDYTLKVVTKTNEDKALATERLLDLVSGISQSPQNNELVYVYNALKLHESKINQSN